MPELPEVTTVIGILKQEVLNKKIVSIDVFYDRMIQNPIKEFKETLLGKRFLDITRKGKFIIFHLNQDAVLLSHLRMEGKYFYGNESDLNPQFTHVVFHFEDNTKLAYFDTRKFGIMKVSNEKSVYNEEPLNKLGPEPMEVNYSNIESVFKKLNRKKPIKELITDQSVMAGIGNIYADEILFKCKVNPLTFGSDLSTNKYKEIIEISSEILLKAIELGGSTIKSYHPKEGVDGRFQIMLEAYGHQNEKCPNCGTLFHKIFLNGRGTTFCPNCQIDYSLKKAIGVTGPIGAGKSEITKIFADLGYFVVSSDRIVEEIYHQESTKKLLEKYWKSTSFLLNNQISHQKLRELITHDPKNQEILESIIHPLVEKELIEQVRKHPNKIVLEIPLLFKAHLQYLCEHIIFVTAKEEILLKRLEERNYPNAKDALNLYYKNNNFVKEKNVVVIENSGSKEELVNKVNSFINDISEII